jgi:hypothetical protein
MPAPATKRIEVEMKELEALLERVKSAVDQKDYELLEKFLASFAYLTELIEDKDTSIARLRKILFGSKSEKSKDVLKEKGGEKEDSTRALEVEGAEEGKPSETEARSQEEETKEEEKEIPGHGRNSAEAYTDAERAIPVHKKAARARFTA